MDSDIQVHILTNLKELNTTVGTIAQSQKDMGERLDKFVPWVKNIDDDVQELKTKQEVTSAVDAWKIGSYSAGAGAVLSFAAQWVAVKLGFKLH